MNNPVTSRGPWIARLARKVILDVRHGNGRHRAALDGLAARAPELVVELLVEIARQVDNEVTDRLAADDRPEDTVEHVVAREAHARRDRGDRSSWVLWGDRTYHRLKARRRRQKTAS